jgi:hypothetical protein
MLQDEVSHPYKGVRPPADHWVDRPEVYDQQWFQPTGTNRPRTCRDARARYRFHRATRPCDNSIRFSQTSVTSTSTPTRVRCPAQRPRAGPGRRHSTDVFRGHSGGGTPGPIPNPEVKPSSADGTARATVWESRSPRNHFLCRGSGLGRQLEVGAQECAAASG